MKQLRFVLINFFLGFIYLGLVAVFGESHPFTRYPMFSSFPNYADYYYTEDENGHYLATTPVFGRSTGEIKDLFQVRQDKYGLSDRVLADQITIGKEVGPELLKSLQPGIRLRQLNIIHVHIIRENGKLQLYKNNVFCQDI